jgi:hypothetical protein
MMMIARREIIVLMGVKYLKTHYPTKTKTMYRLKKR